MGIRNILICFLIGFGVLAHAQSAKTFQSMYSLAKTSFNQGEYNKSFDLFKEIAARKAKNNNFYYYSHYYCALSAINVGKYQDANFILYKLIQEAPNWKKIDEAYYLSSYNSLLQNKLSKGYEALNKIQNKKIKEDAKSLWQYQLALKNDLEPLFELQCNNPEDKFLLGLLTERLVYSVKSNKQHELQLQYLVQDYKLDSTKYFRKMNKASVKKEEYNVALLLPYKLNAKKTPNRYSKYIEFYKGFTLAIDSLAAQGIIINLYTYDTKRDTNRVKEIISNPEFKNMDFIVGPVSSNTSNFVIDFCESNEIIYCNPFNNNDELIESTHYSLLHQPSNITIAKEVAKYAFKNRTNDSLSIFYGPSKDDSIQAHYYKLLAESEKLTIHRFRKIKKNEKIYELDRSFVHDSIIHLGHIFIAGDQEILATNMMRLISKNGIETPVYASSAWLESGLITYDQLLKRQIHFYYYDYVKHHTPEALAFRKAYNQSMYQEINPTIYGALAFDMMKFFGHEMHKKGNIFHRDLSKDLVTNTTNTLGIHYGTNHINRFVPILKFTDTFDFEWVNSPQENNNGNKK